MPTLYIQKGFNDMVLYFKEKEGRTPIDVSEETFDYIEMLASLRRRKYITLKMIKDRGYRVPRLIAKGGATAVETVEFDTIPMPLPETVKEIKEIQIACELLG